MIKDIKEVLRQEEFIQEEQSISENTDLIKDLKLDYVDIAIVLLELEEKLKLNFKFTQDFVIDTVGDIIKLFKNEQKIMQPVK